MTSIQQSFLTALCMALLVGCTRSESSAKRDQAAIRPQSPARREVAPASPPIVAAARLQVGRTVTYDPAYVGLKYPGGDVPSDRGVCTDVVIRALRHAYQMDLQELLHQDMRQNFTTYPKIWGLKKPDPNIDHRRVPNLRTFFQRKGFSLNPSRKPNDYLPGDLVTCTVGGNRPHIMIVSDQKTPSGVPLVIHNIGSGTQEENRLFDFPITGHYRIKMP